MIGSSFEEKILQRQQLKQSLSEKLIDEKVNSQLVKKLTVDGMGIWPTLSEQGQALYKIQP